MLRRLARNGTAYRRQFQSFGKRGPFNGRDREPPWLASLRRDRRFTSSMSATEPAYIEGETLLVGCR